MRRILPLAVLLWIALTACANETDVDVSSRDISEVRDLVVEAMAEPESYRVAMTTNGSQVITVDYEKPNQYRTVFRVSEPIKANDDDTSVVETLYVGDRIFTRECEGVDENCAAWEEGSRGDVVVGVGSQAFFPQWPAVAVEIAYGLSLDADGEELVVRGSVNLLRAILESQRRIFETAGVTAFGRECTILAPLVVDGTPQRSTEPAPTEVCRDTTYEDLLEQEADDLAAGDANPVTIEVRIDPDTYLFKQFEVVTSPQGEDDALTIRFEYSDFNEVTIGAPEGFE